MKVSALSLVSPVEEAGEWFDYHVPGVAFRVRPDGCRRINEYVRQAATAAGKTARNLDPQEFSVRAVAHAGVVDWRGITDDAGNPLPYDPAAMFEAMQSNAALWAAVQGWMRTLRERIERAEAETLGN